MARCREEVRGVNNLNELAELERYFQHKTACELMTQGVRVMDPYRFDMRGQLTAGRDVSIDVNVILEGNVSLGNNCHIGPNVILRNVVLADGIHIKANSVIEDTQLSDEVVIEENSVIVGANIDARCTVGPFARIRPGTHMESDAKVGNFVEIKNTQIGQGSKASHLSYLGDATIGRDVNIGAGTITCNYDGVNKHKTVIKDRAFIGSNTQLVAPRHHRRKRYHRCWLHHRQ